MKHSGRETPPPPIADERTSQSDISRGGDEWTAEALRDQFTYATECVVGGEEGIFYRVWLKINGQQFCLDDAHDKEHADFFRLMLGKALQQFLQNTRSGSNGRAETGEDTKRLDWLEHHPFTAYQHRNPETRAATRAVVVDEDQGETYGRTGLVRLTLREAIDAARAASSDASSVPTKEEQA